MHTTKHILSGLLIVAIAFSGWPVFSPHDTNRDGNIGLEDAMMSVKDFSDSATDLSRFETAMRNTVTAMKAAAGITTSIKSENNFKNTSSDTGHLLMVMHQSNAFVKDKKGTRTGAPHISFNSYICGPESPPPQESA